MFSFSNRGRQQGRTLPLALCEGPEEGKRIERPKGEAVPASTEGPEEREEKVRLL